MPGRGGGTGWAAWGQAGGIGLQVAERHLGSQAGGLVRASSKEGQGDGPAGGHGPVGPGERPLPTAGTGIAGAAVPAVRVEREESKTILRWKGKGHRLFLNSQSLSCAMPLGKQALFQSGGVFRQNGTCRGN